ncbi:MAG: 50S ribosomal protein L23 [Chloroflexi bacterium]|nr:50S ribosomal protein L23 [Chloroflexota bacterium]|tara:strand:- start:2104 stop:2388 length:285 start_codon:yes stop_codon:yes gene_type:complete
MKNVLVLKKPVVTEKSTAMNQASRYVFEVDTRANKMDVKNAVQSAFNVTVLKVNIMNIKGKKKRFGPKISKLPDRKKAIVTLSQGDSITIFEGV